MKETTKEHHSTPHAPTTSTTTGSLASTATTSTTRSIRRLATSNVSSSSSTQPAPDPSLFGGEHRLRSENLAFEMDVWYPPLADFTFASVFLPLTRRDAEAIVAFYNTTRRHVERKTSNRNKNVRPNEIGLAMDHVVLLQALERRIDHALRNDPHLASPNTTSMEEGGAFLRLCGRSPKDGEPTDRERRAEIWQTYQEQLQELQQQKEQKDMDANEWGNLCAAAILRTTKLLRVRTGADAMALLLTSERVYSDLLDWLQYGEPEQVVLRKWSSNFDLTTEFRCYVGPRGVLVGICQYDPYVCHDYLQDIDNQHAVIQAVLQQWMQVRTLIETIDGSYCADFGVNMTLGTAQLIELSPFRKCTGPSLFAWKGDFELIMPERSDVSDTSLWKVLTMETVGANWKGFSSDVQSIVMKSAVFRFRSKPIAGIGELVAMNWDYQWSEKRHDAPTPHQQVYEQVWQQESWLNRFWYLLSSWPSLVAMWLPPWIRRSMWSDDKNDERTALLFVYGTLKRQCHWHSKYLSDSQSVGSATTVQPHPLVVGQCGVPYLLDTLNETNPRAKHVRGKVWRISSDTVKNIDDYEDIGKNHYIRKEIDVALKDDDTARVDSMPMTGQPMRAFCYFYAMKQDPRNAHLDESLMHADCIAEYTVQEQKKSYKPIHHIQAKQLQYLGERTST